MRVLKITDTAVDLSAQNSPFNQGATVVILNLTAGALTLQDSDASGSGYGTLASIAASEAQEVTFDKQYVKLSTAAEVFAFGN